MAIGSQRLIRIEQGRVYFKFKNYRKDGRWEPASLKADEFMRRFLLHVLPKGFHRIRHFGFLANGCCKQMVSRIRAVLAGSAELEQRFDRDFEPGPVCPQCGLGRLHPFMIVHRFGVIWTRVLPVQPAVADTS